MQISTLIAIVLGATATYASHEHHEHSGKKSKQPSKGNTGNNVCGNGQQQACCNVKQNPSQDASLGPVLGSLCQLQVGLIPIGNSCGNQQEFCCSVNQNGLINVGELCFPIAL